LEDAGWRNGTWQDEVEWGSSGRPVD